MATIREEEYAVLLYQCATWALHYDNIIPDRVKLDALLVDLASTVPKTQFERTFAEVAPHLFDLCVEVKDAAAGWVRDYYEPNNMSSDTVLENGDDGPHPMLEHYLNRGVQEGRLAAPTVAQLYLYLQTQPECALKTIMEVTRRQIPELF